MIARNGGKFTSDVNVATGTHDTDEKKLQYLAAERVRIAKAFYNSAEALIKRCDHMAIGLMAAMSLLALILGVFLTTTESYWASTCGIVALGFLAVSLLFDIAVIIPRGPIEVANNMPAAMALIAVLAGKQEAEEEYYVAQYARCAQIRGVKMLLLTVVCYMLIMGVCAAAAAFACSRLGL